jgi:hypothetical protein
VLLNKGFNFFRISINLGIEIDPIRIKTPVELNRSKAQGKNSNKTQAIIYKLLEHFPGKDYYCFMDNLFISENFLEFLRSNSYNTTGICYTNAGIIMELIDLKKKD